VLTKFSSYYYEKCGARPEVAKEPLWRYTMA